MITKVCAAIICSIVFAGSLLLLVEILGRGVETVGVYQEQSARCLRDAANPLEAKRCGP